jgi:hypothetical protein
VICERCGTVFCWDDADQLFISGLANRRRFCSERCRKQARRRAAPSYRRQRWRNSYFVRNLQLAICAEQGKKRYESKREAHQDAKRLKVVMHVRLYPYECACGWWHLTSKQQVTLSTASPT